VGYGEKVVFVGDCVQWEGMLGGELVQVSNKYKGRDTIDPHTVEHQDMYVKMAKMGAKLLEAKTQPVDIRLEGCPVSVAELVLLLSELGGIQNPYFEPSQVVSFNRAYLTWRAVTSMKRLRGEPYQIPGSSPRGEAAPKLEADRDAGSAEE
jgi:hypothetical protein